MRDRWRGVALILLAAVVACVPVVRHMPTCGDDLQFHMLSWFDAQRSWRLGVAYPQWSMSANFGAGEPRFVFYPPLTWMLGALLGLALPWTWVPVAMMFVLLAGSGFAARAMARRLLPETTAAMAGVAAVWSLYALFTAYDRTAFGELAGGVWVPLVLLYAMEDRRPEAEVWRRAMDRALPLALAVAACWLSDAPAGVMAVYLLIAVSVASAVMAKAWFPLVRAAVGGLLGVGVMGAYLVPAAWEQRWVNIREAAGEGDPGLRVENNWLFGHSALPGMATHDAGLHFVSEVVVAMVGVAVVCAGVVWWRGRESILTGASTPSGETQGLSPGLPAPHLPLGFNIRAEARTLQARRMWVVLACVPVAVLVLQLPLSAGVWQVVPKLRFLQFPWRWLLVLEAPLAVLLAGALWPSGETKAWKRWAMGVGFGGVVVSSLLYVSGTGFMGNCNVEEVPPGLTAELAKGAGSWGADEYATLGSEDLMVASGLPDVCVVEQADAVLGTGAGPDQNPAWTAAQGSCLATAQATVRTPDRLRVSFDSAGAGWAVVKLRRYPAWQVRVNEAEVRGMPVRVDGLMVVPVAKGRVEIVADWTTTEDVVVGRWLSVACAVMLAGVWWMARGKRKGAEA
jgi:hypothetical protein